MKEIQAQIYHFLATNDLPTLLRQIGKVDPAVVAKSIYTWLVVAPICIYLLWTKKFKAITALVSLFLFFLLIQKTLVQSGDRMNLHNVLVFIAGTVGLISLNLYLLFVRE